MRAVLASLVGVVCPPEAKELGLTEAIVDHVELSMGALPPRFQQALRLGLATYDLAALLWVPARGRRAQRLPRHLAAQHFERWLHGPTPIHRQFAIGIKQLLVLAHFEQPVIQERLGYRPAAWIDKVKKRRLEVYADDIGKHQASLFAPDPLVPRKASKKEVA